MTTTETRSKRSEEQILADMEDEVKARRKKLMLKSARKTSAYLKKLEAARKALKVLAVQPDWPAEPYSVKLLEVIDMEVSAFVQAEGV